MTALVFCVASLVTPCMPTRNAGTAAALARLLERLDLLLRGGADGVELTEVGVPDEAAAGGADRVHDRLVDRPVIDVADERLGLEVGVGDHDGGRLVDVDAARDRLVLGDGLDPVGGDEDLAAVVVDLESARRTALSSAERLL